MRPSSKEDEPLIDWRLVCICAVLFFFSSAWVTAIMGASEEVQVQTAASEALSNQVRNVFDLPYLLILILVASKAREVFSRLISTPSLLALTLLPFASVFWSIDPAVTIRRSVALLVTVLGGIAVAEGLSWRRVILAYALVFAAVICLCYGYALLLPAYGKMWKEFPGAWRGVWSHKNTLGGQMGVGVVVLLCASIVLPAQRWIWRAFAALALGLLLLSTSKTALMATLCGVGAMAAIALTRRGPVARILAVYLAGSAALGLGVLATCAPNLVLAVLGKDATLTGRNKIWAAVEHQVSKQPLGGYGFGAVWSNTNLWSPLAWITKEQGFLVGEAHNAWLEVALDLGFVGAGCLALLFFSVLVKITGRFFDKSTYLTLPFLLVFLITSLTEANAMAQNDWDWMLVIVIAAKLAQPRVSLESRRGPLAAAAPVYGLG